MLVLRGVAGRVYRRTPPSEAGAWRTQNPADDGGSIDGSWQVPDPQVTFPKAPLSTLNSLYSMPKLGEYGLCIHFMYAAPRQSPFRGSWVLP
jgi:hypothetical protein